MERNPPKDEDWIEIERPDNDRAIWLWRRHAVKLLLILEWRKQFHGAGMCLQQASFKELKLLDKGKKNKNKNKKGWQQ